MSRSVEDLFWAQALSMGYLIQGGFMSVTAVVLALCTVPLLGLMIYQSNVTGVRLQGLRMVSCPQFRWMI